MTEDFEKDVSAFLASQDAERQERLDYLVDTTLEQQRDAEALASVMHAHGFTTQIYLDDIPGMPVGVVAKHSIVHITEGPDNLDDPDVALAWAEYGFRLCVAQESLHMAGPQEPDVIEFGVNGLLGLLSLKSVPNADKHKALAITREYLGEEAFTNICKELGLEPSDLESRVLLEASVALGLRRQEERREQRIHNSKVRQAAMELIRQASDKLIGPDHDDQEQFMHRVNYVSLTYSYDLDAEFSDTEDRNQRVFGGFLGKVEDGVYVPDPILVRNNIDLDELYKAVRLAALCYAMLENREEY